MKIKNILAITLILLLSGSNTCVCGHVMVYPIGSFIQDNNHYLVLIAQPDETTLRIYSWHIETHRVHQLLPSHFIPSGVTLNSKDNSFACIDNGRIRIKEFDKRSPKSVDIFDPVSAITTIGWLDDTHLYLCAQLLGRFGIFIADQNGDLIKLLWHKDCDYIWPEKTGSYLACIKRTRGGEYDYKEKGQFYYSVEKCKVTLNFNECHDSECILSLLKNEKIESCTEQAECEILNNFGQMPIAYLQMMSPESGLVLSHPSCVEHECPRVEFGCWLFDRSSKKRIFSFSIPSAYVWGAGRLAESLRPFVPQYSEGAWYFLDETDGIIQLHRFSESTQQLQQLTHESQDIIGFQIHENRIFYGAKCAEIYDGAILDIPWVAC